MRRPWMPLALIPLLLGLGLASQTAVASNTAPSRSVLPRVVVTVMALDPRGLATLQTVDGARDEVVTSTG